MPSGSAVGIVEMTGVEEDLLTSQRLIKTGEAINQVHANCVKRVGDNDLPICNQCLDPNPTFRTPAG